jgi:peptidoglycan-associated lipoprotein
MKHLLVICCVLLISACATSTGRDNADLGSGANKQVSPVQSTPKAPTTAKSAATPTTKDASTAKSAAPNASQSAQAPGTVSTGPAQSNGSASARATEAVPALQPEVGGKPSVDAEVTPLAGQETAPMRGDADETSATTPSDSSSSSQAASNEQVAAAAAAAAAAAEAASSATAAQASSKAAAAATSNAAEAARSASSKAAADAAKAKSAESHASNMQDADDATMTGKVTEQQLVAANPMLAERSVYYDFDKYDIKEQYAHIIEAHAHFLVEHPTVKIFVEGNCDDRGSPEYNLVLGQRRAESVQKAMLALGVAAKQIEAVSFGAEKPVAPGHDEESWAKNRRSDIVYPMQGK